MGNLSRRVSEIEKALQELQLSAIKNSGPGQLTQTVNAVEAFAKKTRADMTTIEAELKKTQSDMNVEINANRSRFDMLKTSTTAMDARLKAVESRPPQATSTDEEDVRERVTQLETLILEHYNELKSDLEKKSNKRTPKKK